MKENKDTIINPIYYWTTKDIWEYIKQEGIAVNPLYKKGYERVGCIGCPLANYRQRMKEFHDFPEYKKLYIQAFEKMIEARKAKEKKCEWETGEDVFNWWIEEYKHNVKGQYNLFDEDIYG